MKRRPEIAAMNVFLCLLVIFIHVTSAPINAYDKNSVPYALVFFPWRLSSFVVQDYIFLGSLRQFLTKKDSIIYGKYYLGCLTKIILPYIVWNVIYYLYPGPVSAKPHCARLRGSDCRCLLGHDYSLHSLAAHPGPY